MATKPAIEKTEDETVLTEPQSEDKSTGETVPTEPVLEAPPHAGFTKNGGCLTCSGKIRTNTEGKIFCPIDHPSCPRNK